MHMTIFRLFAWKGLRPRTTRFPCLPQASGSDQYGGKGGKVAKCEIRRLPAADMPVFWLIQAKGFSGGHILRMGLISGPGQLACRLCPEMTQILDIVKYREYS